MEANTLLDFKRMHAASLKFLEKLGLQETYEIVVTEAKKLVKAEYGSIFLKKNRSSFERVYASAKILYKVEARKRGYVYQAYVSRKPIFVSGEDLVAMHPEIQSLHIASILYLPLSYHNKSMGVLALGSSKAAHFSKNELDVLSLFGSMASLAIRKAQLHTENKQALEARDLFIAIASHELKTPLTSMNGYIELLHKRLSTQDSVEGRWVKHLYEESIRLTNLVTELMEINNIKTGQFQYVIKECSLREIIGRVTAGFHFIYPQHTLVLVDNLSTDDILVGDFDKLLQAFANILNNAAKYSLPEKEIRLTVSVKGPNFVVKIADQGKGIEPDRLPIIFDGFGKKHDDPNAGLGLGLLLAKHIIVYHRGYLVVSSQVNKGTTVEIILPKVR